MWPITWETKKKHTKHGKRQTDAKRNKGWRRGVNEEEPKHYKLLHSMLTETASTNFSKGQHVPVYQWILKKRHILGKTSTHISPHDQQKHIMLQNMQRLHILMTDDWLFSSIHGLDMNQIIRFPSACGSSPGIQLERKKLLVAVVSKPKLSASDLYPAPPCILAPPGWTSKWKLKIGDWFWELHHLTRLYSRSSTSPIFGWRETDRDLDKNPCIFYLSDVNAEGSLKRVSFSTQPARISYWLLPFPSLRLDY